MAQIPKINANGRMSVEDSGDQYPTTWGNFQQDPPMPPFDRPPMQQPPQQPAMRQPPPSPNPGYPPGYQVQPGQAPIQPPPRSPYAEPQYAEPQYDPRFDELPSGGPTLEIGQPVPGYEHTIGKKRGRPKAQTVDDEDDYEEEEERPKRKAKAKPKAVPRKRVPDDPAALEPSNVEIFAQWQVELAKQQIAWQQETVKWLQTVCGQLQLVSDLMPRPSNCVNGEPDPWAGQGICVSSPGPVGVVDAFCKE